MNKETVKVESSGKPSAGSSSRHRKRVFTALYVIVGVCLCLAWAAPVRDIISRRLWPAPDLGPRDAYSFTALAYTQAPRAHEDGVPVKHAPIHDHIDALVANGFVPVTLKDVTSLLHRGSPLPRKAVLLTVDAGSKEFLHDICSAAWRFGWNGVAFFNTAQLADGNDGTPDWRTVRKLARNSRWETGLSGHMAAQTVPTAGGEGRYLTSRMWLAEAGRHESDKEFQLRVAADYQTALALAAGQLGSEPAAYAYPGGDFGQYGADDGNLARTVNLQAASSTFDLAFTLGAVGRNTMYTDSRRLNRLEVDPDWTAGDLIEALKQANRPVELVEDVDMTRRATGWTADRGRFEIGKEGLTIAAAGASGGANVWLGGSDARRDFSATIDFSLHDGIAGFYARADADRSAYLLIEFDADGNAVLKQKSVLQESPVVLARTRTAVRKGKQHQLAVFMRDSNINVTVDGLMVFNTHEQASGLMKSGLIGASATADRADGKASMTIGKLLLQRRRSTLASWDFPETLDPYAINWIQKHGSRLTEISPPFERLANSGTQREQERQTTHIYRRLAGLYNLRLTPCLRISTDKELAAWTPVSLAGTLADLDCDGLYVNFEHYDKVQIGTLENWLRQTGKMLSGAGRPVLVRLPRMLDRLSAVYSLLAMIPSVEIVTDSETQVALESAQAKQIHEEVIATPTQEELNSLPPAYAIDEPDSASRQQTIEMRLRELIDEGETAFQRGLYEGAIAAFSEWHRLAPESPVPPRRIGDALSNLGYHDEAAGFYRQSLDIAPAQIDLATRYARLLGDIGRKTEARSILNTYARLFPESGDVLLAQAEWLYRENRSEEARQRAARVILLEPDHFEATLFMLRIAENEITRTEAIEQLMSISKTGEQQFKLISAIWQHDLLTYQNSHLFIKVMDQIARENPDPRILEMIRRLDPLDKTVAEDFQTTAALSPHWQVEGAEAAVQDGRLSVRAAPARNEFSVRLLRSERWRDSFIEVATAEVNGGFWLYGRRSRNHLVRFGFDPGGERLNLQVWKGRNNDVVASQFTPWVFPEGGCTLRLEIRGKGVTGLVDGKPVFEVPLALPEDFGLGWTAFAVHANERGRASAAIRQLASGPLPVRIALTPDAPADNDNGAQTARLRGTLDVLTDVSPDWFSIDSSGSWNSSISEESDFFRLFARYYRLRLTPTVRVSPDAAVTADDIITVCRTHGFDGLVLWFETMPGESWFDAMDRDLNAPGIDVVAIGGSIDSGTATIRGIAASRTLFRKLGTAVPLSLVNTASENGQPDIRQTDDPVMFRF